MRARSRLMHSNWMASVDAGCHALTDILRAGPVFPTSEHEVVCEQPGARVVGLMMAWPLWRRPAEAGWLGADVCLA